MYIQAKKNKSYDRKITYLLIREKGQWVVDDIIYSWGSARKQLKDEIAKFSKN